MHIVNRDMAVCIQAVVTGECGQCAILDENTWQHARPEDTGQHLVLLLSASKTILGSVFVPAIDASPCRWSWSSGAPPAWRTR